MTQGQLEGSARELVVTIDLMRRGFEVFRTVCPNSSFDIVAHKNGFLLRIEVKGDNKTRTPRGTGPVGCIGTRTKTNDTDCRKFDILAAVKGNSVRYLRSALHTFNAASKELVGEEVVNPKTTKKNLLRRESMV